MHNGNVSSAYALCQHLQQRAYFYTAGLGMVKTGKDKNDQKKFLNKYIYILLSAPKNNVIFIDQTLNKLIFLDEISGFFDILSVN